MGVDPDLRLLGRGVQRARKAAGVSQEELGDRTGLHRNYIGQIERGERNPTATALIAIARALSVSLSELVEGVAAGTGGSD